MKKYGSIKPNLALDIAVFIFIICLTIFIGVSAAFANPKKAPKTQEVNFDGSDVDGEARRPDGAYLSQRRGGEFIPLYKVREQFDQSIKDSVDHLR
jgi:hypothetical protein